jgi:hypothetical protein
MLSGAGNFVFLKQHDIQLARLGALAQRYFHDDPNTCLIKLRQFGETLAQLVAAKTGLRQPGEESQADLLHRLNSSACYALIVGALTAGSARHFQSGPPTRLSHAVKENELLTDAELRSADQKDIAGHFARKAMTEGEIIEPSDVSDAQNVQQAGLAALAPMTRKAGQSQVAKGDAVRLCLDGAVVGIATAEAATCDAAACLMTVRFTQLPKELLVPDAAGRLKAIPAAESCQ